MKLRVAILAVLCTLAASPAWAQQVGVGQLAPGSVEYPGVIPGTDHPPPRVHPTPNRRAQLVTWPGFQLLPGGVSRVFVQTSGPVEIEQHVAGTRQTVLLRNTGLGLHNNRYPLETRYFDTPVVRASMERHGRHAALVVDLSEPLTPEIHTEAGANGYFFVFVDVPPATLRRPEVVAEPVAPPQPAPEQAPVAAPEPTPEEAPEQAPVQPPEETPAAPSPEEQAAALEQLNNERPPDMGSQQSPAESQSDEARVDALRLKVSGGVGFAGSGEQHGGGASATDLELSTSYGGAALLQLPVGSLFVLGAGVNAAWVKYAYPAGASPVDFTPMRDLIVEAQLTADLRYDFNLAGSPLELFLGAEGGYSSWIWNSGRSGNPGAMGGYNVGPHGGVTWFLAGGLGVGAEAGWLLRRLSAAGAAGTSDSVFTFKEAQARVSLVYALE